MATKSAKAKKWMIEALLNEIPENQDRWGNFKHAEGSARIKFNKTSWRYERNMGGCWMKVSGKYYTTTVWADIIVLTSLIKS